MPKMIESMTKIYLGGGSFMRVWREESETKDRYDNRDLIEAVKTTDIYKTSNHQLAEIISKMPRVAAVEVVDAEGCGVVIYTEWP